MGAEGCGFQRAMNRSSKVRSKMEPKRGVQVKEKS